MATLKMIDNLINLIDEDVIISADGVTEKTIKAIITQSLRLKPYKVELYKNVKQILDSNSICHWLDCGALIGAFRNNAMIPHDWDIDIAVYHCDMHKLYDIFVNKLKSINNDYVVEFKSNRFNSYIYVSLQKLETRLFEGKQWP
eukprot:34801_1